MSPSASRISVPIALLVLAATLVGIAVLTAVLPLLVVTAFAATLAAAGLITAIDASRRAGSAHLAVAAMQSQLAGARDALAARARDAEQLRRDLQDAAAAHREALAVQAALRDRERDAQRRAEEAARLRDDFLGTVSHELRTPLNAIVGWLHILERHGQFSDESRRAVEAIARNARAQARVVDNLLDVARIAQGRTSLAREPNDLVSLARLAVDNLRGMAEAKRVRLDLRSDHPELTVSGDEGRLLQALHHLIANAVKFTPREGRVEVQVAHSDGHGQVCIEDDGDGIEPGFLPYIFDPFRQDTARVMRTGLGVGLTIVRELVELHGGTVQAFSEGVGKGARFTVTLPLVADAERPPVPYLRGMRVLVAEDDDEIAEVLLRTFRAHGGDVRVVQNSRDFLTQLLDWQPQVLVCDTSLRNEDAFALLQRVRNLHGVPPLPAIALTSEDEAERHRAIAAGYGTQIPKPPDATRLLQEVASAVRPPFEWSSPPRERVLVERGNGPLRG